MVTTSGSAVLRALRCIGSAVLARVATAAALDEVGAESELIDLAVAGLHDRFLGLNGELLDLCTAWQVRYADRLGRAVALVRAGERQYLVDDLEAFHTIRFQLHEDLLVTLGIPR